MRTCSLPVPDPLSTTNHPSHVPSHSSSTNASSARASSTSRLRGRTIVTRRPRPAGEDRHPSTRPVRAAEVWKVWSEQGATQDGAAGRRLFASPLSCSYATLHRAIYSRTFKREIKSLRTPLYLYARLYPPPARPSSKLYIKIILMDMINKLKTVNCSCCTVTGVGR